MGSSACTCAACVDCCRRQPASLAPGDLERIAGYLGEPLEIAKTHFVASPGAVAMNSQTKEVFRIGTITPDYDHVKRRCVFLTDAGLCSIHPVKPHGCAHFDPHMPFQEGHDRAVELLVQQSTPAYQALRATLAPATLYRPRTI